MSELKAEFAIAGGTITAATIDLCVDLSKQEERDKLVERLKRLFADCLQTTCNISNVTNCQVRFIHAIG
jgi:hypothetical protein